MDHETDGLLFKSSLSTSDFLQGINSNPYPLPGLVSSIIFKQFIISISSH